jgi:acetyl esterase/lipase
VARYLADNGLAAFAIDYRLAHPGPNYFPYPAPVQDVEASVRWVRTHAGQFNVDPKRLGMLGSSAGGNLANLVAMMGSGPLDQGDRVRAVVSWSGPNDLSEMYRDAEHRAIVAIDKFTDCNGGPDACAKVFRDASPITYVDPSDPALFFPNGTTELVPLAGQLAMDQKLTTAGVPHELVQVPGSIHAQGYKDKTAPTLPAGETIQQASLAWLKKYLNAKGGATGPTTQPPGTQASAPPKKSGSVGVIVLVAVGLVVVVFAVVTLVRTLRKRADRARRIREWEEGQPRSSRSGSRSSSSRYR